MNQKEHRRLLYKPNTSVVALTMPAAVCMQLKNCIKGNVDLEIAFTLKPNELFTDVNDCPMD